MGRVDNRHLSKRSPKKVMVFYTPIDCWGPAQLIADQAATAMSGEFGHAYREAKRFCHWHLSAQLPIHIDRYLACLEWKLAQHSF